MYVDAFFDRKHDILNIVERINGKRNFIEAPVKYTFYYDDPKGKFQSVEQKPISRIVCKSTKDYRKELGIHSNKKLYESDINPIVQYLSEYYIDAESPNLHVAFFDIETDFDKDRGYARPDDTFLPITSVSVYLQWLDTMVCLAVIPKTLSIEQAKREVDGIPNVILYESEAEMLEMFLTLIEDSDVLSGWNSEAFDIPYTVNRVIRVLGKDSAKKFCLWNQSPKKRTFERYGKESITFDLIGRIHLDYLELYRKYTYEERSSYRLDFIGEFEVDETKVPYEGTLDQLYNNDFRKFIEYNIQDTALLNKLDRKLNFIELSNNLAHANTVLLPTTLGSVAVSEQAIINEAHSRGLHVPDRSHSSDDKAAGAYVAYPKKGLHKWIGSMDLNSLYPSVIRALNMAPETIVGQLRPEYTDKLIHEQITLQKKSFAAAWEGHFASLEYEYVIDQRKDMLIHIDWKNGKSQEYSGAEIYKLIFDSNMPLMLSANGTIFTLEVEGVIPGLLKRWYDERKQLQKKTKNYTLLAQGIELPERFY